MFWTFAPASVAAVATAVDCRSACSASLASMSAESPSNRAISRATSSALASFSSATCRCSSGSRRFSTMPSLTPGPLAPSGRVRHRGRSPGWRRQGRPRSAGPSPLSGRPPARRCCARAPASRQSPTQQVTRQRARQHRGDQRLVVGLALLDPLPVERVDDGLVEPGLAVVEFAEGKADQLRRRPATNRLEQFGGHQVLDGAGSDAFPGAPPVKTPQGQSSKSTVVESTFPRASYVYQLKDKILMMNN